MVAVVVVADGSEGGSTTEVVVVVVVVVVGSGAKFMTWDIGAVSRRTRRLAGESIQSMSGCVDHDECFFESESNKVVSGGAFAYAHESYFDIKINNIKRAPKVSTPTGT